MSHVAPRLSCGFAFLCLLLITTGAAWAQEVAEDPEFDEDQEQIAFGGLIQTQFRTTSETNEEVAATELFLRRVRLSANARANDFVSGRIQAEFAGAAVGAAAEVNEAYLLLSFHPAFEVLAGKGGRPFGLVDANSAASLIPVERGARFGDAVATLGQYRILEELAYAGRSVGVQVLGETEALPLGVTYAVGYFSGALGEEGPPADIEQFAGRVQVEPVAGALLGVAYTNREFGDDGTGESERGGGYALDLQLGTYGEPGPKLLAQYTFGTFDPFAGIDFRSVQVWGAWRFAVAGRPYLEAVEPLFRVSWGDLDGDGPGSDGLDGADGMLLTPGLNLYAGSNSRLMLNLDVFLFEDAFESEAGSMRTPTSFKAQFQLAF
jgi:hypothetical protein